MGKISKALDKYAIERKASEPVSSPATDASPLTHDDILALVAYDEASGHLVQADPATGDIDERRIEELRASGTVLRLLENQLIYPGGKLTARGIKEARRLAAVAAAIPPRPATSDSERERFHGGADYSLDPPNSSKTEPKRKGRLVTASKALDESEEAFTGTHAALLNPEEVRVPSPAVPCPLKDVPNDKFTIARPLPPSQSLPLKAPSKISYGYEQSPVWDESVIDPNLVVLTDPQSPEAEQFKILRTNILFPLTGSPPRSILVTSPGQSDGKTFTAANLAISIAINFNRHVLLIDADMRRPQLHKRFGFGSVPGLSNYLAEGSLLPSLLLKTKVDKLTLLPAGAPPDNPAELIGAERMSNLLSEVTNRYPDRIVVIDAPPPAMAAETGVLARQVDGILVVVRYGSTRRDDLADLVARVGEKKILGSIVNYIETSASRYYGYKYGGYGRSSKK